MTAPASFPRPRRVVTGLHALHTWGVGTGVALLRFPPAAPGAPFGWAGLRSPTWRPSPRCMQPSPSLPWLWGPVGWEPWQMREAMPLLHDAAASIFSCEALEDRGPDSHLLCPASSTGGESTLLLRMADGITHDSQPQDLGRSSDSRRTPILPLITPRTKCTFSHHDARAGTDSAAHWKWGCRAPGGIYSWRHNPVFALLSQLPNFSI